MKIKWGALVVDGRGKIGGHVGSKNRAGSYLRTKVVPVNPQTASQSLVRSFVSTLSRAWAGLSEVNRNAWNGAVEAWKKTDIFGDLKSPSGFNLYMRLNLNLLGIGEDALDVPPAPVDTPNVESITLSGVAGTSLSLAYVAGTVTAAQKIIVEATAGMSHGKSYAKNAFRKIAALAGGTASPFVATTAYGSKFGSVPVAGNKVFFRVKVITIATGQASSYLVDSIEL
jgi:hypothetical protein